MENDYEHKVQVQSSYEFVFHLFLSQKYSKKRKDWVSKIAYFNAEVVCPNFFLNALQKADLSAKPV